MLPEKRESNGIRNDTAQLQQAAAAQQACHFRQPMVKWSAQVRVCAILFIVISKIHERLRPPATNAERAFLLSPASLQF